MLVSISQILIRLSKDPVINFVPFKKVSKLYTDLSWALRVFDNLPLSNSQIDTPPLYKPPARSLSFFKNFTLVIPVEYPYKVFTSLPVLTSQTLAVLSIEPEASNCPFVEKSRPHTSS